MPPSVSKRPPLIRQKALNSSSEVKNSPRSFQIDDINYLRSENTDQSPVQGESDPYDVNWKSEIKYDEELLQR